LRPNAPLNPLAAVLCLYHVYLFILIVLSLFLLPKSVYDRKPFY